MVYLIGRFKSLVMVKRAIDIIGSGIDRIRSCLIILDIISMLLTS